MTQFAFVGTGFVADYYMTTLTNHPDLKLAGVFDIDKDRLKQFCDFYNVTAYADLEAVMNDPQISIIVILTTPESHYELALKALQSGKHVYCEKPLAMGLDQARHLVELADERGLTLVGAPSNALSDACQLVRDAIQSGKIGNPKLVYAEMEDGPVFRQNWQTWRSRSGAKWPGIHEFEIGCTLEHAGYILSWLTDLFGPVEKLTSFSALTFPDKGPGTEALTLGPDFSVGCLTFRSQVIARLTCGLAASRDRSMTIIGDAGILTIVDLWDHRSTVYWEPLGGSRKLLPRLVKRLEIAFRKFPSWKPQLGEKLAYPRQQKRLSLPAYPSQIDFVAGIEAQAAAIKTGTKPESSGERALHITELALALSNADQLPQPYLMQSSF